MSAKNLTGHKRILQDHVVSLFNCVQDWKLCTSDCYSTVRSICLVKQKSIYDQDQNVTEEALSKKDFFNLESLSSELLQKLKKLEVVAEKMRQIPRKLENLRKSSYREQSCDENFHSELSKLSMISDRRPCFLPSFGTKAAKSRFKTSKCCSKKTLMFLSSMNMFSRMLIFLNMKYEC
ncbi:unnamed protein product [Larinioides sclopetarius]|uniref:Uncharacterized protein n=1 Tax=Larinioides sclopetarius TaxID=280406 RepID=A0AAV1ZNN5_9ARAC